MLKNNCYSIMFQLEVAMSFVIPFTIWLLAILKRSILLLCLRKSRTYADFNDARLPSLAPGIPALARACGLHWPPKSSIYLHLPLCKKWFPFRIWWSFMNHSIFLEKNWRESDGEKSFTEFPNQLWLHFGKVLLAKQQAWNLVFCCWLWLVYRKRVFYIGLEKRQYRGKETWDLRVAKQCNPAFRLVEFGHAIKINSMLGGNARKLAPYQTIVLWFFWWWSCGFEAGPVGLWAAMLLAQKAPSLLGMEILLVGIFEEKSWPQEFVWFFFGGGFLNCRGHFFDSELEHSHIEELLWWKLCAQKGTAFNMDGLRPFLATSTSHSHIFCFQY